MRRLTLLANNAMRRIGAQATQISALQQTTRHLGDVQVSQPAAPAANLLWNGELGHSVNSWHDTAYTSDDKSKECAWWFSFCTPFVPKTFTTITTNDQIPVASTAGTETGTLVQLTTTGTLPTGLSVGTNYFLIVSSSTIYKLASSRANALAGTAVSISAGTGSGTHTIAPHLETTDARTSSTNHELKSSTHSQYGTTPTSAYGINDGDWERARGFARLTGLRTLAQPLPNNFLEPGMIAYTKFILARRTAFIDIPTTARLFAGIFDSTSGQRDFLKGDVGLTAAPIPAGGGSTERRYRIYVETDRGFSILSPEVAVANGWSDAQFSSGNTISLSWRRVVGVLRVQIWRYTPSSGIYHLLEEISSGTTTYIDNNTFLRTGGGYPTATTTERKALFYTVTGDLSGINVDGLNWDTLSAPIHIPDNYNKANTTDRQWLIIGLTEAPDLFVTGCTTDGTANVTVPTGAFEATYDSLYDAGTLVAKVYDENDNLLATTTLASRTSDTVVVLGTTIATGTNRKLRIVGGGFHGVLVDKVHMSLQPNTSFAPNPVDARVLQPVAAPSSGQGGVGGGDPPGQDPDDGGVVCVAYDVPILMADNWQVEATHLESGMWVEGEHLRPNEVGGIRSGMARTRSVRTANGLEIRCTNSHRFCLGEWDGRGSALAELRVGDRVMTKIDGRFELSPITHIGELGEPEFVVSPKLLRGRYYIAGTWSPRWWQRLAIELGLMRPKRGGILAHNTKLLV